MSIGVDASQIEEALRALESLGYDNPTAEDIALTLQHARQTRRRDERRLLPASLHGVEESLHPASASPPHGANDVTMLPHTDADGEEHEEKVTSNEADWRPTSNSLKQWPGLSSRSIRGGRTTPMNSTGTGGCVRPLTSRSTQGYSRQRYHRGYVDGENFYKGGGQGNRRTDSNNVFRPLQSGDAVRDGIWIPTANVAGDSQTLADYVSPPARLERHLKRHEKGLKSLYVNRRVNDGNNFFPENDSFEIDATKQNDEEEASHVYEDGYGNHVPNSHRVHSRYTEVPEMPMRERRAVLNQRNANVLYSFTGDSRYKYRGGAGVPLRIVLGSNGSTLRQRADPVQRGRQMRELWNNDRFLTQQGRKEDRWRVRQNMLAWDV